MKIDHVNDQVTVVTGTFEELAAHMQAQKEAGRAAMTDADRALCDGKEHWALILESQGPDEPPIVCAVHVLSIQQRISVAMKYLDDQYVWGADSQWLDETMSEVDSYYDEDGVVSYGFLPCETWDSVYEVDSPDFHDRHVTHMLEIPQWVFHRIRAVRQDPDACRTDPVLRQWMIRWLDQANLRQ